AHRDESLHIPLRIQLRTLESRDHQSRRREITLRARSDTRKCLYKAVFHDHRPLNIVNVIAPRSSTIASASRSSAAGYVCVTATVRRPASRVALIPQCQSSIATEADASAAPQLRRFAIASR